MRKKLQQAIHELQQAQRSGVSIVYITKALLILHDLLRMVKDSEPSIKHNLTR